MSDQDTGEWKYESNWLNNIYQYLTFTTKLIQGRVEGKFYTLGGGVWKPWNAGTPGERRTSEVS